MASSAVSNTSPLIVLGKAGMEDILRSSFDSIAVPEEVAEELGQVPAFVSVLRVTDRRLVAELQRETDRGEAAAVALASERRATVVLDDLKGRRAARRLGLPLVGTLGLVLKAKSAGRIESARDVIHRLREAGLYLDDHIVGEALRSARED